MGQGRCHGRAARRRIGLIGVDFTEHHFFAKTGRHPLAGRLAQIDREYGALADALGRRGIEFVNLSATSRLQSPPRARLADFDEPALAPRPAAGFSSSTRATRAGMATTTSRSA
ncbi:MAG TPA: hypothetical protein VF308_01460 [Caldimonas sp.]